MALTTKAMKELREELECLKADRAAVEARISALECILESGAETRTVVGSVARQGSLSAAAVSRRPPLRGSILRTLQLLSKATPAELTRRLQEDGLQVGGSTSLRERVWHELSRLRRTGFVRRTRGGHYQLRQARPATHFGVSNPADSKFGHCRRELILQG